MDARRHQERRRHQQGRVQFENTPALGQEKTEIWRPQTALFGKVALVNTHRDLPH